MSATRVMPGIIDMEGQKVNTLSVGQMVSRHPRPRYETTCQRCGARSTESQDRLTSGAARCLAANCGKVSESKSRDLLAEQRWQIAERENQRRADELAASQARMEAESEGWERPTRYAPTPDPCPPMSAREVRAARERREAEETERREAERPRLEAECRAAEKLAQAEEQLQTTASELARIQRDAISNGKDDAFVIDPATTTGSGVPGSQVAEWHQAQFAEFLKTNPHYFRCNENAAALTDYLERNAPGLRLVSAAQLTAAFRRLNEYGLLKQRPAPQPESVDQAKQVNLSTSPEPTKAASRPKTFRGRDYLTGLEREFTEREVNRMGSLEYQRAFAVVPTVAQLFTQMSRTR